MKNTIYAPMSTKELVELALCRDNSTELETELAQRLEVALDMIDESSTNGDS
jgi:hypothetical protein